MISIVTLVLTVHFTMATFNRNINTKISVILYLFIKNYSINEAVSGGIQYSVFNSINVYLDTVLKLLLTRLSQN